MSAQPDLHAWLAAPPRGAAVLRARVRALDAERRTAAPASVSLSRRARADARAILADPVFRHPRHAPRARRAPSLVERFFAWLGGIVGRALSALFRRARVAPEAGNAIGYGLLLAAAIALTAVVARLVRRAAHGAVAPVACAAGAAGADDGIRAADDAARMGDFTRACTAAFTAALRRLDRAGIVAFDPARTPGEYRRMVRRSRATLDEPFAVVARAYVVAVFGERAPDAAAWSQIRSAYDRLDAGAGAP